MEAPFGSNRELRRYLLGDSLPEEVELAIEERYFQDPAVHLRLECLEDEVIDDYVKGALSAADRQLFERNFLQSERRFRKWAERDRAVAEEARATSKAGRQAFNLTRLEWLAAAAVVVFSVASGASALYWRRIARDARSQTASTRSAEPVVFTAALTAGNLRSAHRQSVRIPSAAVWVILRLTADVVPGEACSLSLQTPEGQMLWAQSKLKAGDHTVVAKIPRDVLTAGDYILYLSIPERAATLHAYVFDVMPADP